jgi:hypothetical protein
MKNVISKSLKGARLLFVLFGYACLMNSLDRFKYDADQNIRTAERLDRENYDRYREEARNARLEHNRQMRSDSERKDETLYKNWKKTQVVKKDRLVRDLQYELALLEVDALKKEKARQKYDAEQKDGTVEFEKIMKRSGIGANDSGNPLSISYEDGETFLNRLETTAQEKWPTKEEVGDFITQLKRRTNDNRVARYEKARRRRRAAVDQAAGATTQNEAAPVDA